MSKAALQSSKLMTDNIQTVLTEFRDQQRDDRRAYEEAVKKSIRTKKNSYDQLLRVQINNYERSSEATQLVSI